MSAPTPPRSTAQPPAPSNPDQPMDLDARLAGPPMTALEAGYARTSRAANTLRGYRCDWREFTTWCTTAGLTPIPATPATVSAYLADLAAAGAAVGTISRRRSSLAYIHTLNGHPDPTRHPRVQTVWDGIRREHATPPEQATPLMPPLLFDVLDACPTTRTWKAKNRADEPDLAGARDRALLLVGFVAALRRSELAVLTLADVRPHPRGLILTIRRSKTNQTGDRAELVILPRSSNPTHCPVTALHTWLDLAELPHPHPEPSSGPGTPRDREHPSPEKDVHESSDDPTRREIPLFQGVSKGNRPSGRPLNPESINTLVQNAITRAGHSPTGYSAHSLRAGFVTYSHLRGASDRAIAHQTRHRSLATIGTYVRYETIWQDNAANTILT